MEKVPFNDLSLDNMRHERRLGSIQGGEAINLIMAHTGCKVLVPMNETAFGGKPSDWSDSAEFTDFIFQVETACVRKGGGVGIGGGQGPEQCQHR